MEATEARTRFAAAHVARLATAGTDGRPHLVPVVFALDGDTLYTAVDDVKPKATTRLRRLANIAANPAVALLADHYEDDWSALWWVRADGTGRLLRPGARQGGRGRGGGGGGGGGGRAARAGRRRGGAGAGAAGRALPAVPGGAAARRRD